MRSVADASNAIIIFELSPVYDHFCGSNKRRDVHAVDKKVIRPAMDATHRSLQNYMTQAYVMHIHDALQEDL